MQQNQSMQMQFATIQTEIEAARLLTYNAARMKEEGRSFVQQAAMAKWYSSVVAQKASGSAIEWAGGIGCEFFAVERVEDKANEVRGVVTRESGIEKFWRDSKVCLMPVRFEGGC